MNVSEDPRPDGEAERQSQDEEKQRDHEERRGRLSDEDETSSPDAFPGEEAPEEVPQSEEPQ